MLVVPWFSGVAWKLCDIGIVYSYGSDYADGDAGIGGVQLSSAE